MTISALPTRSASTGPTKVLHLCYKRTISISYIVLERLPKGHVDEHKSPLYLWKLT